MSTIPFLNRLAVCSWSLQPEGARQLIEQLKSLGLPRVQLALDPLRERGAAWVDLPHNAISSQIQIVSGMMTTVGEDYTTMESIRRTGGLVPDATWDENWKNFQAIAGIARSLRLRLVTFHAGFLPHDERDPQFAKLADRVRRVARLFAEHGIDLALETGQESAATLNEFLLKLNCPNVGVNFDPANMILYDQGDPIAALRRLAPWLKQCHIKDARRTKQPGTWGEEVAVGTGEVDWPAFFRTLAEIQFTGDCCIEREAGTQRLADIRTARELVERVNG